MVMNIDKYNARPRGFISNIAPYATASSGAALGFLAGGPVGAVAGLKLGYDLGSGNTDKFLKDGFKLATGIDLPRNDEMKILPINNKRKR